MVARYAEVCEGQIEGPQRGIEWFLGHRGGHGVVASCTEGVQRGIEWLLGAWRGDMEQLLGAQRACRGV